MIKNTELLLNAAKLEALKRINYANIGIKDLSLSNAASLIKNKIASHVLCISNVYLLSKNVEQYNINYSSQCETYNYNDCFKTDHLGLNAKTIEVFIVNVDNPNLLQALVFLHDSCKAVTVSTSSLNELYNLGYFYINKLTVRKKDFLFNGAPMMQEIELELTEAHNNGGGASVSEKIYKSIYNL